MPYDTVLLITGAIAALATGAAMCAIVFLAWAPHVSGSWGIQLGVGIGSEDEDASQTAD